MRDSEWKSAERSEACGGGVARALALCSACRWAGSAVDAYAPIDDGPIGGVNERFLADDGPKAPLRIDANRVDGAAVGRRTSHGPRLN